MNILNVRKRVVIVFIYLLAMLAGLYIVLRYMQVTSDMSAFLPQGATQVQKILFKQYRHAAGSRAVMIGIEGKDISQLIRINKKVTRRLKQSGLFSVINNGQSVLPRKEVKFLFDHRFALSDTVGYDNYKVESLRSHLEKRLESFSSALSPIIKKTLPRDPAGEFENILSDWRNKTEIKKISGVFFSRDNQRSLVLVMPAASATDLNKQQKAIDEINIAYNDTDHEHTRLLLSGPVIIALSAREQIQNDVKILSLAATLIVIVFLYLAFRSLRIVLLSAVPLASGMLAGAAATTLIYENVHGITIAFGVTLIGIAVDYPMHFFSHLDSRKTPFESIDHIWSTLRLSVLTTMIGFSSLLFSGYSGLSQLAVFSIFGVIVAVLTTRFLLPGVLATRFQYPTAMPRLQSIFKNYAIKAKQLWPVLIILFLVSVAVLVDKSNIFRSENNRIWNDNLQALSPASAKQLSLDRKLRHDMNLRYSNDMIMITGASQEAVLQSAEVLSEKLDAVADQGIFEGYESITTYLPSKKTQTGRLKQIPDEQTLRSNLRKASKGLPFREGLFDPFLQDIKEARAISSLTLEAFTGTLLADKLASLLFQNRNIWATSVLLYDVKKPEVIRSLLAGNSGNQDQTYIKLSEETKNVMTEYRKQALVVFSFGALAIVCILWAGMGSLRIAAGVVVVPFSVLLVDSAILSLFDIGLTLFHLVAMLLVAGLGIDYALFFNRIRIDASEWETSFPALWKSWLTTVLVFGSLMISDTAVLEALGQTVTLGVTLCFLFGLIWTRRFSSTAGSL